MYFVRFYNPMTFVLMGQRVIRTFLLIPVFLCLSCSVVRASGELVLPRFPGLPTIDDLTSEAGVPVEHLQVKTQDDYLLTLHRLGNSSGRPILVMHGLLNAADIWLTRGRQEDLVYMLLDGGYDVYLGNMRGTTFSRSHVYLKPTDPKFWDFSFHESGFYDIPAMVDYILKLRGGYQVFYLGHSLGTTVLFVMCSSRPEYNSKIRGAALTSPVAYLPDLSEFSLGFARLAISNRWLLKYISPDGRMEMFPRTGSTIQAMRRFCAYKSPTQDYCLDLFGQFFGEHRTNIDRKWFPFHASFYLTGTSLKNMLHLGQLVESAAFTQFNLGEEGNLVRYNTSRPPQYPLERVTAPIALFWSWNDKLVSQKGIERLKRRLPNLAEEKITPDPKFTHVDTYVGLNAKKVLYKNIVAFFNKLR